MASAQAWDERACLLRDGACDRQREIWSITSLCKSRTEGFTDFIESLEKFTPEYAEEISGVPAEDIRKAARMYANAKNAAIYWGMGISQLSHGTASALALIHLAFLTGHIGRDGTGLNPLRGQNNVQGASDMGCDAVPLSRLHARG